MTSKRRIDLYYDVIAQVLREEDGSEVRIERLPFIFFREKPLLNLRLVINSDLDPYEDLESGFTLEAAIDNEFTSYSLMCKALNSDINQANDWWNGTAWDTADIAQGEVSVRLNANTTNFSTKITGYSELQGCNFELLAKDGEGIPTGVFRFPWRCLSLVNDSGEIPEDDNQNIQRFTDPATGKKGVRILNDDGEVLETLLPM